MPPPLASAMAIIGDTAVNVTPCSSGSLHPDLPEPDGLDDRGDTAGEQVGVDQMDQFLLGQPDRAGQQDRHHHRAGVERQHVLDAVDRQLRDREYLVDRMLDRLGTTRRFRR